LQTSELALEAGLAPELAVDERLQPGGGLETLLTPWDGYLGLVGHEPDLGHLACALLRCAPGALVLKKAGVIQLRRSSGQWQLQALLRPALLIDDLSC
jgi:phosphohistidine phosphatase